MISDLYSYALKRWLDLIGVFVFIIMFFWIPILILIAYILTREFPVFYCQNRVGKNNSLFTVWKFRTLSTNEGAPSIARVFGLGRFLRRTNLDESPQLWNILKGEMSFIGPRPLPTEYLPLYSETQKQRHNVRPGITGWAQVNGRNSISWKEKFDLDLYYVNNFSFKLDALILIKTIVLLFSFKQDRSLEEEKFDGTN